MKIGTRRLTYIIEDLEQLSKINILQGNSATGKTEFFEECLNVEAGLYGHFSTREKPVHSVVGTTIEDCNLEVSSRSGYLIVVDEDSPFIRQDSGELQKVIYSSSNTFMIITREKKLNFLSIPIDAIYIVVNQGKYNIIRKKYKYSKYTDLHAETDIIITEDKKSSFYFFRDYFDTINIFSAGGKDNVKNKTMDILHHYQDKNILVVIDACAFGLRYEQLEYILKCYSNVSLVAWKCFEEYLLRSPNFKDINTDELNGIQREEDYEALLSKLIKYNKSSLTRCIRAEDVCNNCKSLHTCRYRIFGSRINNYIHSELLPLKIKSNNNVVSFLDPDKS